MTNARHLNFDLIPLIIETFTTSFPIKSQVKCG